MKLSSRPRTITVRTGRALAPRLVGSLYTTPANRSLRIRPSFNLGETLSDATTEATLEGASTTATVRVPLAPNQVGVK